VTPLRIRIDEVLKNNQRAFALSSWPGSVRWRQRAALTTAKKKERVTKSNGTGQAQWV
jgi:hypothetical protein